jgi:hypothetical protein
MTRLGLTAESQRLRIRDEINDRLRQVTSTLNLGRTRRASKTFTTVSGTATVVASGISTLETLYDPTTRKRPLEEVSMPWIRARDAASSVTGAPEVYAVQTHTNDVLTLRLYPKPDAVYSLLADVFATGTELDSPEDEPAFPSDFHDLLVDGVLADEYNRVEKARPMAQAHEAKFEKRLSELRLHVARSAWLSRQTTDNQAGLRFGAQRAPFYTITP